MTRALFLAALLAAAAPAQEETNFLAARLATVELGEPMQSGPLILIPLLAKEDPAAAPVVAARTTGDVGFAESRWPERRYNVEVTNKGDRPTLVLGGTILVGGKLDRMAPRDVLVPPGEEPVEVHMLPAEYQRSYRSKPGPFKLHFTTAPAYLRERAVTNPHRNLVPRFVSHFLEFRPEKDERLSLAAIDESPALAKFCVSCHLGLAKFPDIAGKRVVGFVAAVRGRVQSLELFADNALLKTYFEPLIRAHAYAAAAIELRAERAGLKLPKTDAAALAKAKAMAAKLLADLRKSAKYREVKAPSGTVGQPLLVRRGSTNGYAIGYEGTLVHAVVFPYDPFESRLYGKRLDLPDAPEDPESVAELNRRETSGARLTEYEKRLLDRVRGRRDR